jgi:hypothetical protein
MRVITRCAIRHLRCLFLATSLTLMLGAPAASADTSPNASATGMAQSSSTGDPAGSTGNGYAYGRPAGAGTGHKVG